MAEVASPDTKQAASIAAAAAAAATTKDTTADTIEPSPAKRAKTTAQTSLTSFFRQTSRPDKDTSKKQPSQTATAQDAAISAAKDDEKKPAADNADTTEDTLEAIIPQEVSFSPQASWRVYQNAVIYRQLKKRPASADAPIKVAGLDLDGTLLEWRIAGWPSRLEHYELWNGSVVSKVRELADQGHHLVIFSNQGGIRGAHNGKRAAKVKQLIEWLSATIDRPVWAFLSTDKKHGFYKPSSNMWTVAESVLGLSFDTANSFFVGDSVGDDDAQGGVDIGFAQAVSTLKGVELAFHTPTELFGPSHKEQRLAQQQLDYEVPPDSILTRAALTGGYLSGPILLILCGAQGSGKSFFSEQLVQNNADHWIHLSQDTINNGKVGKREAVEVAAQQALATNKSVIIDRMHLDETQRAHFVQVAKEAGVSAHAVVLKPPKDVVAKRVLERENHIVQGEQGAKLAADSWSKLIMPKYDEGLALISASSTAEGARDIAQLYRRVSTTPSESPAIPAAMSRSGIAVPSIALGTMGLGKKAARDVVSTASNLGFEAFDTAPTYKNEDEVGAGMQGDSFCSAKIPKCATKGEDVRNELNETLYKLNIRKPVDLLLLHWPCDVIAADSLKEVWREMEAMVKEKHALALGVCNFNVAALRMLLPHCTTNRPIVNQVERHPLLPQWELVDFCAQHDILLQAHTPLGHGKADLLKNAVVKQVATRTGHSVAQVILQWNLQHGVAVVPKCSSKEHMMDVLAIRSLDRLSSEDMKALDEIEEKKRFVAPPFMFGAEPYCWGSKAPKASSN